MNHFLESVPLLDPSRAVSVSVNHDPRLALTQLCRRNGVFFQGVGRLGLWGRHSVRPALVSVQINPVDKSRVGREIPEGGVPRVVENNPSREPHEAFFSGSLGGKISPKKRYRGGKSKKYFSVHRASSSVRLADRILSPLKSLWQFKCGLPQ